MSTYRIDLPYATPPLSMNDRGHWATKARLTASVRRDILSLARFHRLPRNVAHASIQLHYRPRDRRRRDTDNLVATLKPCCDALAAGTARNPGYGLVPDDTPEFMAKPEPIIHLPEKGNSGHLWLEITTTEEDIA